MGFWSKVKKGIDTAKTVAPMLPIPAKFKRVIAKVGETEEDVEAIVQEVKPKKPAAKTALPMIALLLLTAPLFAQTPVGGTERLAWTHDGVNVERFEVLVDTAAPVALTVTQAGTDYRAPLPALTPGTHTIGVRACNVAGCSAPLVISVRVVIVPGAIVNLRVVPGGN